MKKRFLAVILIVAIALLSGCSVISVKSSKGMVPFMFPTEGTSVSDDGTIKMTTNVEDNRFSYVVLQLYSDSPKTHVMNISTSNEGKADGVYTHEEETGSYIITLKANSNKQDEGVDIKLYLVKGKSYAYSYNVKTFGEKDVTVENFVFGIK